MIGLKRTKPVFNSNLFQKVFYKFLPRESIIAKKINLRIEIECSGKGHKQEVQKFFKIKHSCHDLSVNKVIGIREIKRII